MAQLKNGRTLVKPAVVQLDIDDTLYEYEPCHQTGLAAMQAALEEELNVKEEAFLDAYARARSETKDRLGPTASSHSRLLYAARALELLGMRSQPATALKLEATYWREFLHSCERFVGVEELLMEFRLHDVPICVVTDLTSNIQYRKLLHLRVAELIDWVVTSEEVTGDKETHAPYELMLTKMSLERSAPIWVIGDSKVDLESVPQGVTAFTFLRLNGRNGDLEERADVAFHDFPSLLQTVRPALQGSKPVASH